MDVLTELKKIKEFSGLEESHLQWLTEKGHISTFTDGEKTFRPGDPVDDLRIVLKGEVNIYREQAGNMRFLGTVETGEITGLLPYSRMKGAFAEGVAGGETIVFGLNKVHFPEMIREHHPLTEIMVHLMTDRVREYTALQQQNDKMMALGKLSAGLAHELNNPSAAVVRSAHELKKHLANLPEKFKGVIRIRATEETVDMVNQVVFTKISAALGQKQKPLKERTKMEDALVTWLESNDMQDVYEMAETFASFDFGTSDLEKLKASLRPEDKAAVIDWINQVFMTERLVNEIEEASRRINALVSSVKSYTHMDRTPEKEQADVHTGIRNTLTMLNHKIRKNNVRVIESIPDDLPQVRMYVSSMNQVWTNLIDNALDALEGQPDAQLEIRAEKDREFIVVDIIDNGPGIPEDIQDKIFDSFFTTKPVGKGTGLGLEVVRQIISQHEGRVSVESKPGHTVFNVCFPINAK